MRYPLHPNNQTLICTQGQSAANIAGNLSDYSTIRQQIINGQVKEKYDKMLHREQPSSRALRNARAATYVPWTSHGLIQTSSTDIPW